MAVWLVTGGTGFLGRHVVSALRGGSAPGAETVALGRRCPDGVSPHAFVAADLEQPETVARALVEIRPDVVIHVAGCTPPGVADRYYRVNTLGTLHLLDALRAVGRPVRVVLAGSAAELGPVAVEDLPVGEDYPCCPADAYGVSKWLATCAGVAARPPLEVIVARVFNPIGPGQPPGQFLGRVVTHLIQRNNGPLVVGNLDARRDFIDVRDVARALIALAVRGRASQIYHVGTGRSQRVGDGLTHLIRRSGRSIEVHAIPEDRSGTSPMDSRADVSRIVAETDWSAEIPWMQSLDDLWDDAEAGAVASVAIDRRITPP